MFTPPSFEVHGASDCMELQEDIIAKRGIRLEGRIEPPIEKVKISILNESDEIIVSMLTDKDGKYKFTPLHSDHRYRLVTMDVLSLCLPFSFAYFFAAILFLLRRVIGEKEGYLLTGPFDNGLFKAHKLAEIQVKLVDEENKPLQVSYLRSETRSQRQYSIIWNPTVEQNRFFGEKKKWSNFIIARNRLNSISDKI